MKRRAAPAYAFETLLAGLADAFESARREAQARYASQLHAFAQTCTRHVGPIEAGVSVASLRAFRQMRVRDVAIEFDCAVRTCRKTSAIHLVLSRPSFWRRQSLHRVRIEIADGPQPQGSVSIDGRMLKRFATGTDASAPPRPLRGDGTDDA